MANYRNSAEVLDAILQKAGETTNGNSQWETLAVTYANDAHRAIIAGGSIFDLEVDEPWTWARSRHPIVLELQPAYLTGTLTCTRGSTAVSFSSAPTSSLEGWHVQVSGKPTVYKITQHTANGAAAALDSSFVDSSGTYNFRAFKLDYEITPAYVYVDNVNDRLDFQEGTAFTTRTASLTHGSYTPAALLAHAVTRMGAVSTSTFTSGYDVVLKSSAITCSSSFKIIAASGANNRRSGWPLLGFDLLNYTGSQSYTSTYTPNQVGKLIEPFKLFSHGLEEPFVYSSDPVRMQQDYPISMTEQRIPDRFVRIAEGADGQTWVRFNAYPAQVTKVQVDWIPIPLDIQDNSASVPLLPQSNINSLIHCAAALIAFDKNDNKWEALFGLGRSGIEAMKRINRAALFRTGESFGQIIPREDLNERRRRLDYGYTVSGNTTASAGSVQTMIHTTLTYSQFASTNDTVASVTARILPADHSLFALIVKHSTSFAGTGISSLRLDVGISGDPTKFINAFDVGQATAASAQASGLVLYFPAAETDILARLTAVGANLTALTAGVLECYFQESST